MSSTNISFSGFGFNSIAKISDSPPEVSLTGNQTKDKFTVTGYIAADGTSHKLANPIELKRLQDGKGYDTSALIEQAKSASPGTALAGLANKSIQVANGLSLSTKIEHASVLLSVQNNQVTGYRQNGMFVEVREKPSIEVFLMQVREATTGPLTSLKGQSYAQAQAIETTGESDFSIQLQGGSTVVGYRSPKGDDVKLSPPMMLNTFLAKIESGQAQDLAALKGKTFSVIEVQTRAVDGNLRLLAGDKVINSEKLPAPSGPANPYFNSSTAAQVIILSMQASYLKGDIADKLADSALNIIQFKMENNKAQQQVIREKESADIQRANAAITGASISLAGAAMALGMVMYSPWSAAKGYKEIDSREKQAEVDHVKSNNKSSANNKADSADQKNNTDIKDSNRDGSELRARLSEDTITGDVKQNTASTPKKLADSGSDWDNEYDELSFTVHDGPSSSAATSVNDEISFTVDDKPASSAATPRDNTIRDSSSSVDDGDIGSIAFANGDDSSTPASTNASDPRNIENDNGKSKEAVSKSSAQGISTSSSSSTSSVDDKTTIDDSNKPKQRAETAPTNPTLPSRVDKQGPENEGTKASRKEGEETRLDDKLKGERSSDTASAAKQRKLGIEKDAAATPINEQHVSTAPDSFEERFEKAKQSDPNLTKTDFALRELYDSLPSDQKKDLSFEHFQNDTFGKDVDDTGNTTQNPEELKLREDFSKQTEITSLSAYRHIKSNQFNLDDNDTSPSAPALAPNISTDNKDTTVASRSNIAAGDDEEGNDTEPSAPAPPSNTSTANKDITATNAALGSDPKTQETQSKGKKSDQFDIERDLVARRADRWNRAADSLNTMFGSVAKIYEGIEEIKVVRKKAEADVNESGLRTSSEIMQMFAQQLMSDRNKVDEDYSGLMQFAKQTMSKETDLQAQLFRPL